MFLLLGLAAAPGSNAVRIQTRSDAPSNNSDSFTIVRYDGTGWAERLGGSGTRLQLSRQGEARYLGIDLIQDFSQQDLHKQFIATLLPARSDVGKCSIPVYVRTKNARLCGTELFSKDKLTCDAMSLADSKEAFGFSHLAPKQDRGFSVEFEYVAREVTEEVWAEVKDVVGEILSSGRILDHGQIVAFNENLSETPELARIFAVRECFYQAQTNNGLLDQPCNTDADCALSQYCEDCGKCLASAAVNAMVQNLSELFDYKNICGGCRHPVGKFCKKRTGCDEKDHGKPCPRDLQLWNWEKDGSVVPLSAKEAAKIGADESQTRGTPFEVTAPGPPHVLSGATGMRAVMEVLTTLKHIGTQAGPSQGLHVHVNVASDDAPGQRLTLAGFAYVWAAYAKYQLVIDEMLSPGRLFNYYAKSLVLGDCPPIDNKHDSCKENPCRCIKRFFLQMHGHIRSLGSDAHNLRNYKKQRVKDFCNAALLLPGSTYQKPCQNRYPNQRYFAVNLVPLVKFGTIEFRSHSASFDPDRIGRWAQFLVGFVEHFGNGAGRSEVEGFFQTEDWEQAYDALQAQQQQATAKMLFDSMEGVIDSGTRDFYLSRSWESGDRLCQADKSGAYTPVAPSGECELTMGNRQQVVQATLKQTAHRGVEGIRTVRVVPPEGSSAGDYISVEMPEGDVRTLKVPPRGERGFTFEDNPNLEQRQVVLAQVSASHRCCCAKDNSECLWFSWNKLSSDGTCPRLKKKHGVMCTMDRHCLMSRECWTSTGKWKHHPGRCLVATYTENPEAYFDGPVCQGVDGQSAKKNHT